MRQRREVNEDKYPGKKVESEGKERKGSKRICKEAWKVTGKMEGRMRKERNGGDTFTGAKLHEFGCKYVVTVQT